MLEGADKTPLCTREHLATGQNLELLKFPNGQRRWTTWDADGNLTGSGFRRFSNEDGGVDAKDVNAVGLTIRQYRIGVDGGTVRGEKMPDGTWTWTRFSKDGTEGLSGTRNRPLLDAFGWRDTFGTGATARPAQEHWSSFNLTTHAGHYREHPMSADVNAPGGFTLKGSYKEISQQGKDTGSVELLDGNHTLQFARYTEQRIPDFMWKDPKNMSPGVSKGLAYITPKYGSVDFPRQGFAFGDSRFQVFKWIEKDATGARYYGGVRVFTPDGSFSDFAGDGLFVRGAIKLDNGHTVEIGRIADGSKRDSFHLDPVNPNARPTNTLNWKEFDGGKNVVNQGTRTFDGKTWIDSFPDCDGVLRVIRRNTTDDGDVVRFTGSIKPQYHPTLAGDLRIGHTVADGTHVSIVRNTMGQIVKRTDPANAHGGDQVWKEYNFGSVWRQRQPVDGHSNLFMEKESFQKQWRSTDQNGVLLQFRSISGRVMQLNTFGRWTLVGTEREARGLVPQLNAFRGWNRSFREPNRMQYVKQDGLVGEFKSTWSKLAEKSAADFLQDFLIDVAANVIITGATDGWNFNSGQIGGFFAGAAIRSGFKASYGLLSETALKGFRDGLRNLDGGKDFNRQPYNNDKHWDNEWAGNENPPRWRAGTFDFFVGNTLVPAVGSFLATLATGSSFGFGEKNFELHGGELAEAAGLSMAGSLVGGLTFGAIKTFGHLSFSGRWFHQGGIPDITLTFGEKLAIDYLVNDLMANGTGLSGSHEAKQVQAQQNLSVANDGNGAQGQVAGESAAMAHRTPVSRPVIAIAGLGIESSTFSPARTHAAAFHPQRADDVLTRYPFLGSGAPLREAADWRGALVGKALPGGTVTAEAFAALSDELIARLSALSGLDGLWYDIHGAMTVEGIDDAEALLLARIRETVGPDVVISTSMDLHGNVSRELAHQSDLITCYRMAPHEDHLETKERAVRNLVDLLVSGAPRPVKAWIPVPVLLAGEQTSTRIEPARGIYAAVPEVEALDGVIDAAIWVGYAWADEPRNHAAIVVTGQDEAVVAAGAERLARAFWTARHDFAFVAPTGTLDACLDQALASAARPFFISDSGDNPTAGGAGDVTWSLERILAWSEFKSPDGPTVIYASVPGPEAVDAIVRAGMFETVTVTAGAEVDDRHAGPVTMTGVVHAIRHGDRDAETEVVLRVGSVHVIITRLRKPYHYEHDFAELALDLSLAEIVVVKIGYLEPELFALAADWLLALTPGGVDQELTRLGHRRIQRPMFPFDPDMAEPDLRARIIPASHEPLPLTP